MKKGIDKFSKRLDEIFDQGMPTKVQIIDAYNKFSQHQSECEHNTIPQDVNIIGILNKYSKTDYDWLRDFYNQDILVIDPMDYHKIAEELSTPSQHQPVEDKISATAFVESCGDMPEYVAGKKVAHRFRKYTIPVIEYNELRKAAKDFDNKKPNK